MKLSAEEILHIVLKENGYQEHVTFGSGFSKTIVEAMELYAEKYNTNKTKTKKVINKKPKLKSAFIEDWNKVIKDIKL